MWIIWYGLHDHQMKCLWVIYDWYGHLKQWTWFDWFSFNKVYIKSSQINIVNSTENLKETFFLLSTCFKILDFRLCMVQRKSHAAKRDSVSFLLKNTSAAVTAWLNIPLARKFTNRSKHFGVELWVRIYVCLLSIQLNLMQSETMFFLQCS